jgi:hypothetical protein
MTPESVLPEASMSRPLALGVSLPILSLLFALEAAAYDFSVDPTSPEIFQLRYQAQDIIQQNGAGVLTLGSALGLGSDQLDEFSYGKDILRPLGPKFYVSLQFSVSRATVGGGGAVSAEVARDGAAGDKFNMLILPNQRTVGPFRESNAPDHMLTPGAGASPSQSNIDGLSWPPGTKKDIYYTVARGGSKGPSDIWYVAEPGVTAPVIYALASQLGLGPNDNIDGLAIKDGGARGVLDSMDLVFVSLDTQSPTRTALGGTDDILRAYPQPTAVAIPYTKLDLSSAPTEEIDAITAYDPGPGGAQGAGSGVVQSEVVTSPGALLEVFLAQYALQTWAVWTIANRIEARRVAVSGLFVLGTVLLLLPLFPLIAIDSLHLLYRAIQTITIVYAAISGNSVALWLLSQQLPPEALTSGEPAGLSQPVAYVTKGDAIPGTAETVSSFFHCGGGAVGPWNCATSGVNSNLNRSYGMAWCDDSAGTAHTIHVFGSQGMTLPGVAGTVAQIKTSDIAPDPADPNAANIYAIARMSGGTDVLYRVRATSTASGPSFAAPVVELTDASGLRDLGFTVAAGSAAFHARDAMFRDGIYKLENGVLSTIADQNTFIPGTQSRFSMFFDSVSLDQGWVSFIGLDSGFTPGVYSNLKGRLQKIAGNGDVFDGHTAFSFTLGRNAAKGDMIAFGVTSPGNWQSIVVRQVPTPFDVTNATRRAIHVDVELEPDPALLGSDPRATLLGDLGTARLRGIWSSNGTTATIRIPASELARLVALQFGASTSGTFADWVITLDVASGAIVSSKASGTLPTGPFRIDDDTNGGPWTSPLLGSIPGTTAGYETDPGGRKLFCSNAFSQLAGGACGAAPSGFPAAAAYDRRTGFVRATGPLTLGNVVLWGFLGDQRWLEAPVGPCADLDSDGLCDSADRCPFHLSSDNRDTDGDQRGNPCECTDQNGDGRNTVSDLVAINTAIFNPSLATPLCDGNNDGLCNVNDIIAANVEIFSPTNTSTCSRQPIPGP